MRLKALLAAICVGGGSSAWAEIVTIDSIGALEQYAKKAGAETLAVFDVDQTLTMPQHPALQSSNIQKYENKYKRFMHRMSPKEREIFPTAFVTMGPSILIENRSRKVIATFQGRHAKVIALTGILSGSFSNIDTLEKWRFQDLKQKGIDFSKSFPKTPRMVFNEFPQFHQSYPLFDKGILITNGASQAKAEVLQAFLSKITWKPKEVIFVDHDLRNLQEAEERVQAMGVRFVGLHYVGAEKYPAQTISAQNFEEAWELLFKRVQQLEADAELQEQGVF